jgi:hypothetical protein
MHQWKLIDHRAGCDVRFVNNNSDAFFVLRMFRAKSVKHRAYHDHRDRTKIARAC